jgi:hypothetical protein
MCGLQNAEVPLNIPTCMPRQTSRSLEGRVMAPYNLSMPSTAIRLLTAICRLAIMRMVADGRARKTLKRIACWMLTVRNRMNW